MKRFGFVPALLLGLLSLSCYEASASDVTLSADASVNSAHAATAYGAISNLYVGNGNTTFLKFDLKTLPAGTTSAQVSHAVLTVFVNRVNAAGAVTISPVTAAWNEYSITAATAPPIGASFGSLPVSVPGQFISIDVTAQVQAWLDASAADTGFALASGGANVLFDSKENDETGHPARLDVTLVNQGPQGIPGVAGVAGAVGPAGPQGPQGVPGVQGPAGPAGPIGPTGAAGAGLVYRNAYVAGTTYATNDAVTFNGSTYVSLQDTNVGHQPDSSPTFWSVLAAAGVPGTTGAVGPVGPQGVQGIPGLPGPTGPIGPTGATGPIGPAGPVGATGLSGPIGPAGATGATGPQGPAGPQGPPVNFRGTWSGATAYAVGDAISFLNGSSYIALLDNFNITPGSDDTVWAVLAQAGIAGATGAAGPAGPAGLPGPQGIQGVAGPVGPAGATGAAGSAGPQGPIGATGPAGPTGAAGPAGATGATGAAGPQGPPVNFRGTWNGSTIYTLGDAVFLNGSSYIALASNVGVTPGSDGTVWALLAQAGATGAAGPAGAQGPSGPAGAQGPVGPTGPAGASGSGVNAVTFNMQFVNPGTAGTYYLSPLHSLPNFNTNAAPSDNFVAMPIACTMSALNVGANNYNFAGADTLTLTVLKNGLATPMTCSVTTNGNGASCQDTLHTFSVVGGDSISLRFSETNINPYNKVTVSLVCQ